MILINSDNNYEYTLSCVPTNHGIEGFEKFNKNYDVFKINKNDYKFVLSKDFDTNELYRSVVNFFQKNKKSFNVDIKTFISILEIDDHRRFLEVFTSATEFSTSHSWNLKSNPEKLAKVNFIIQCEQCMEVFNERYIVAQAQTIARKLQDMPSNIMIPGTFISSVKEVFRNISNVDIKVLSKSELEMKKMNLLVGVGKASTCEETDPHLLVISYKNDYENSDDITAFIGKGVCFDTGGLNIKTGANMRWMKYDMAGAAVVAMTLYAIAKNNIKGNFVAVCPLVINLCDKNAQRPDDVLVSYSGKSIEIDNTDAEGRLILADAISYAIKDLKAKKVIDVATLTGAMVYCLGDTYTGVWTNKDCFWNRIQNSAYDAGELVWRMPFHNDFLEMLKSNVADICNSVSNPKAGSSRAACFLKEFTESLPFAHFDIAQTVTKDNLATGIMINTFYNLAKNFSTKTSCEKK